MHKVELVFQSQCGKLIHFEFDWEFGMRVDKLLEQSRVLQDYPELQGRALGIYGRLVDVATVLQPGDRVEIYAPLKIEPMAARRARVKKKPRS